MSRSISASGWIQWDARRIIKDLSGSACLVREGLNCETYGMKNRHATNDLERPKENKTLLKRLLGRKPKKAAPAPQQLEGWAKSAMRARNKS
jgi:hypothetical protein